jgi:hypothetical protein
MLLLHGSAGPVLINQWQTRNIYNSIWPKYQYAHLCGTKTFILIDHGLDPMAVTEIVKRMGKSMHEFYPLLQLRSLMNNLRDCWYLKTQTSAKWEQKYITAAYFHLEMLLDLQSLYPNNKKNLRFILQTLSSTVVTDLFSLIIFLDLGQHFFERFQ